MDFAPPQVFKEDTKIGGRFIELANSLPLSSSQMSTIEKINWLGGAFSEEKSEDKTQAFLMPRSAASNKQEVIEATKKNYDLCVRGINAYLSAPTDFLIINDIGIFLHHGSVSKVKKMLASCKTALLNAYMGDTLLKDFGSGISKRERIQLKELGHFMNTLSFSDHNQFLKDIKKISLTE